jgi:hypothetical protein
MVLAGQQGPGLLCSELPLFETSFEASQKPDRAELLYMRTQRTNALTELEHLHWLSGALLFCAFHSSCRLNLLLPSACLA